MAERLQDDTLTFRAPNLIERFQPLPSWLADRLLRPGEKVEWVRGPWFNPEWERYVTHPGLLLLPLTFGVVCVGLGRGISKEFMVPSIMATILAFVFTIIVLGLANGYFTRLVVTNRRIVILQGYEICRSWNIGDLPPALLHYTRRGDEAGRTINLNAVKNMLGAVSDQFSDAKTILSFGKQLDSITRLDKDHR
ncbi:MAG TPA: hypothetical protein VE999_06525 [Gemmataceae bacterium]|nr:hypothetical protein [Gemmataceae bacterium]